MLVALTALAAMGAAAESGSRPFIDAAGLCSQYITARGASVAPFSVAGFAEAGKSPTEQLFRHSNGKVMILLKSRPDIKVPVCHVYTPAWETEVQALVPQLEPLLGKGVPMGEMTMFNTEPKPFVAFLNNATIQGAHFADLAMTRVDKENSDK
jgi:hypothetical protein